MYPFLLHSLSMSVFSSVIGPFGGFFASGFKRAFKIKVNIMLVDLVMNVSKHLLLKYFFIFIGFRWYDPRSWWNHGPIRLSIPNGKFLKVDKNWKKTTTFNKNLSYPTGYLCQCVHFQLHTHCITRKTSPTGTEYLTNGKFIQRQLIFSNILFSTI